MADKNTTRRGKFTVKIPPARIKKIIQTDDEIGKMATAVPVMIGRSLELFVAELLSTAVDIAQEKHAKTLTPQILKEAVKSREIFRFLDPVLAVVPDLDSIDASSASGSKRRGSRTVADEKEKKPRKTKRRKKQSEEDEDDDQEDDDY